MAKTSFLIAALMPVALLAIPAHAADEAAATAAAAPEAPKEKSICRREVPTGSILPKRTCMTATQWSAVDKQREDSDVRNGRRLDPSLGVGGAGVRNER